MYAIISKGELLALCERPRYVKPITMPITAVMM